MRRLDDMPDYGFRVTYAYIQEPGVHRDNLVGPISSQISR